MKRLFTENRQGGCRFPLLGGAGVGTSDKARRLRLTADDLFFVLFRKPSEAPGVGDRREQLGRKKYKRGIAESFDESGFQPDTLLTRKPPHSSDETRRLALLWSYGTTVGSIVNRQSSIVNPLTLTILLIWGLLFTNALIWADGIILPPPGVSISIKSHIVDVEITDQVATTTVDEIFINEAPFQIEGTYIFPLSEDVSVSEFAMFVDGERLTAELLDSDKAREIYEGIVRRHQDPALLEYIGGGMFRARVFPIPARGEKRIQLQYSEILRADAGMVKYQYPLSTEKFSHENLQEVSVDVQLHSAQPVKAIYSPSHAITVERNGEHDATIRYAEEDVKPDRDFLLYYTFSDEDFGVNLLTHRVSGEDGFYLLMLAPKTEVEESEVSQKNIVFVFDTSGSMLHDRKIEQAKSALKFGVSMLREKDFFNIIDFSTEVRMFQQNPVAATNTNTQAAMKYVDGLGAVGGTNINDALLEGIRQFEDTAMIIFLTDGVPTVGMTNNEEILANVQTGNTGNIRLFVFGIGYDVNTHLLDRLSTENSGVSEYVRPEEDIEVKVSNFFTKIGNPVLSNLRLDFGGVTMRDTYPKQLPDLFAGMQLIVQWNTQKLFAAAGDQVSLMKLRGTSWHMPLC